MRLQLDTHLTNENAIFCRGCDAGRPAGGSSRDIHSKGGIDRYCDTCTRARHAYVVPDDER